MGGRGRGTGTGNERCVVSSCAMGEPVRHTSTMRGSTAVLIVRTSCKNHSSERTCQRYRRAPGGKQTNQHCKRNGRSLPRAKSSTRRKRAAAQVSTCVWAAVYMRLLTFESRHVPSYQSGLSSCNRVVGYFLRHWRRQRRYICTYHACDTNSSAK